MPNVNRISVPVQTDNAIYRAYRHFPYEPEYAIAELIDNATQSFLNNKKALGKKVTIRINYDPKASTIVISDDAMGMDSKDLANAVCLARAPKKSDGRSEFGIGMKSACSWLGNHWTIETKKHGVKKACVFEFDVEVFAQKEDNQLVILERPAPNAQDHGTTITVTEMFRRFQTRTISQLKDMLGLMYYRDFESGTLDLYWNNDKITYKELELLEEVIELSGPGKKGAKPKTKSVKWKKNISFSVQGKKVDGWVGLLAKGKAGVAGFNCFRRGRLIKAKARYAMGTIGASSLVNQRLVGELTMDEFEVIHLKNDFIMEPDLEEEFEKNLEAAIAEYKQKASEYRASKKADMEKLAKLSASVIEETVTDPKFASELELSETKKTEVEQKIDPKKWEALKNQSIHSKVFTIPIKGGVKAAVYWEWEKSSPHDPYVKFQGWPDGKGLDIFLNMKHPHVVLLSEQNELDVIMQYTRYAAIDCIVDWWIKKSPALAKTFESFRQVKDNILRTAESDLSLG